MGLFGAWALCLSLLPLSLAQDCNREFYITSQADADSVGRDCPIVNSSVLINGSYTGSLVLNSVRNITGTLKAVWPDSTSPQPMSVELPDLEYVNGIDFPALTASRFSAPMLETANYMYLGQAAPGNGLSICSIDGCAEEEPYSAMTSVMNLTLSSLTSVGRFKLAVKTERFALRYSDGAES
ncbi:predicted protein [Aspergillus nidulans FGSC A4]|uniref:ML-like domain-containing protein n=1 Tax=Emericella nidulans (strain FGSC A4 / ATCC 38163 / CBS 112.46 / NRRL 194 / M139) TaxID=227321 RepID=Q5ATF2_EMENI|nr:hypothetical protein [Aspergillus nidulans FGSC A4]EAA67050.1 predicted protein [Aspergillus nidulans FGSC A4]CBF80527.1 TPA: conserved hypothetical protein [Aspergillus nidulans FGSC A4]|eukprot:XP_681697.1 predicted protein [Aspergillus nidulans FGSC A4]